MTDLIRSLGIRAYACQPLITGERLIGTLSFGTRQRDAFRPDELDLLQTVSDLAAAAFDRARLMRDLAARATELEELLRARDEFVGFVSHELRAPLTVISGNAQRLVRQLEGAESGEGLAAAATIIEASHGIERRLDFLLALARFEHGDTPLQIGPVDLANLLEETARSVRVRLPSLQLRHEAEPGVVVPTDAELVREVLVNLLENAARHGGGAPVHASVERAADRAILHVRDEGPGIAPEEQPWIFERGFRGSDAAAGGHGLGLYLAREIAHRLGGALDFTSTPGAGTEFRLVLPQPDQQR